ncbi:zinc finger MYM-type protein 4 isoform X1 [Carassius gibelio]|uniref:zinc finger MYM-type protein 4 isoform X1 n=1 Tax=Carassius gibelio TaxID=101364 RepID=UPI00227848AC|nr:zinc finger MYM-type protein 4 isoform X1 [Carassius gibelio]
MVLTCAYPGCRNLFKSVRLRASTQTGKLTFHRFPTFEPDRLHLWLLALQMDINTPMRLLKVWRVCSEHFSSDDFKSIRGNQVLLKSSAVPMFVSQRAEETVIEPDALSADNSWDIEEEDDEVYYADDFESTSGKQKNPRTSPEQHGQLILNVTNPPTEPSTYLSSSGSYYALPPTRHYQMNDPAEAVLQMEECYDVNATMDSGAYSEGENSGLDYMSAAGDFVASEDSKGYLDMYQEEDMAQCSEELVITKVEDTNEMALEQNEDYIGITEADGPEDSQTQRAKDIKCRTMESSAVMADDKRVKATQPSVIMPLKIKDEPMDEECKKAQHSPMGNIKDDEDFDQTPDDVKIKGAPVGIPEKPPSIPAKSIHTLKRHGVLCTACNKVMLKGHTAFQRSGSSKLYCSPQCLCGSKKKTCHCCLKEICDENIKIALVDMSGTVKEFCSQKCRNALNFKCSVCQKKGVTHSHEVNYMGSIHKLCSDSCFSQFRSSNKLNMNSCVNCGGYCYGIDGQCPSLWMEDRVMKFCSQNCLTAYKKRSLKLVTCKMCHALRPAADAVDSPNSEGIRELFCSTSCVMASKVQTGSSSDVAVECNNCKLKLVPQYHISMLDGSVQNFCSYSCVLAYQESLSKTKPKMAVKTVTSTSSNASTPNPSSSDSSSSVETSTTSGPVQTVTKIPCFQCLNSFFHRPELLEFRRKMYAFCGDTCIDEFRRIYRMEARCEYCKLDKTLKIVRRINKVDHSFCSERCKTHFENSLFKRWGKKRCCNCFYCNSTSKTVVTDVFDGKQEEFCGKDCLLKHNLLIRQEIKCSMCKQMRKMTETVKWLGEMKHFCSLRCLMFFCSLQGITGAVIKATSKSLAKQGVAPGSSAVPRSTKEGTQPIAKVASLSSASNEQPGVLGSTNPKGSVPVKVTGNRQAVKASGLSSKTPNDDKELPYKSMSKNKATSCKPNICDAETQIDGTPKVIVLPVPVPVYVPVPMHLYTQYIPQSVGLPLPVPVPLFFPTTLDSAEHIVKTIQEIKEKIPDDPLEADLLMMAEMVAEDAEEEKQISSSDQTGSIMEGLDLEDLSSNLSWEEDSVSSAQTQDQTPEPEKKPPSRSATLTPVSTAAEEPQMDLEADFPIERIELFRKQMQKEINSGKQRSRKRGHDGFLEKKQDSKRASAPQNSLSKLQHEYGVQAWKKWVCWRNAQPNMETLKFSLRSMTLKEDLLKCCTAELSYGLCKFISEVRRPNGEKYSPDSIFYLCLGIQKYLFEKNRMENIFADVFYAKFCQELTNILRGWKPTISSSGYVHSRVEEYHLWDCKQLGAFSPGVLLNTLLYFFTKYFNFKTVEQHRRISFGHIKRYSRGQANNKVSFLRFYPPKEDTSTDGVPLKKKKEAEQQRVLKIRQNSDNPLRCPVKLYEFYLLKCSPGIRHDTTQFYLSPERSCVPSSPTWFSTTSLSDEALDSMLTRILTVRELHLERDQSPNETDSDSDSDFTPF